MNGSLYALLFSTGAVKVGRATNVEYRIGQHRARVSAVGVSIVDVTHAKCSSSAIQAERALLDSLAVDGYSGRREWFLDLPFPVAEAKVHHFAAKTFEPIAAEEGRFDWSGMGVQLRKRGDGLPSILLGVPDHVDTYRLAVLLCWRNRMHRFDGALTECARHIGAQVSHMSDYLSDDPTKRDMPAKFIRGFESWCGNTAITQWMASQARLTVAEELTAMRMA